MDSRSERTAEEALALAAARPATLGAGRLVCVDGPAGSGKTTLGGLIAARSGAHLIHMDDLYDGWSGLPRVGDQLAGLLRPLAEGRPGSYRRYDWLAGAFAETVTVDPAPVLVLEGVGSGTRAFADLQTVLVWVDAPDDERLRRGLARDGVAAEPHWRRWMQDEAAHFARDATRSRADLVLETGASVRRRP